MRAGPALAYLVNGAVTFRAGPFGTESFFAKESWRPRDTELPGKSVRKGCMAIVLLSQSQVLSRLENIDRSGSGKLGIFAKALSAMSTASCCADDPKAPQCWST